MKTSGAKCPRLLFRGNFKCIFGLVAAFIFLVGCDKQHPQLSQGENSSPDVYAENDVAQVRRDIVGKWTNMNGPMFAGSFHQGKDPGKAITADPGQLFYTFRADGTYEEDVSEAAKQSNAELSPNEYTKAGGHYEVIMGEKCVSIVEHQEYPFQDTVTHETVHVYIRDGQTILDFGLGNSYLQNRKVE